MYHIRTRVKQDSGSHREHTEQAVSYNKTTLHPTVRERKDRVFIVSYKTVENTLKQVFVSMYPDHEPPAEMKKVNEVYVMNENGKNIEMISNG